MTMHRSGFLLLSLAGLLQAAPADQKPFYLPKNPRAAAYILGRLSDAELLAAPRSEFVFAALLHRPGLDRKYRLEALEGLAQIRHTDPLTELLKAIVELDAKGSEGAPVLRDLTPLLLVQSPAALGERREQLAALAQTGVEPYSRRLGWAGLIRADQALAELWETAADSHRIDLLEAVPLLREAADLEKCYPIAAAALGSAVSPELRAAAIAALTSIPGHDTAIFARLAALVESESDWLAAANGLKRLAKASWNGEEAGRLVEVLIRRLEDLTPEARIRDDALGAAEFAGELASLLPREKAMSVTAALRGLGVQVITLRAVYEQMLYDKGLLIVQAGKPLQIVFLNDDAMQHNLVIVQPGAIDEVGKAAEKLTPDPDAQGRVYVPDLPQVLHATRLLNGGERVKLSFTAPAEPGDYGYVCTYPGHWLRMRGILRVVPDLEAYLASHAEPAAPTLTSWTLDMLEPELSRVSAQRDLNRGRELFMNLACAQCHQLAGAGYAFGPQLDDVMSRWSGNLRGVLTEILEPSKVISDRYRVFEFELKDGESATGMILQETDQDVTVQGGPSDALIQTLPKAKIAARVPQKLSVMPLGLLAALDKEQIVDLLSFLLYAGHPHH